MGRARNVFGKVTWLMSTLALPISLVAGSGLVHAATTNSLYSYTLDGSTATVSNSAAANPGANLVLSGSWSPAAGGVYFTGNTSGQSSIGIYQPASKVNSVNAPATSSVGAAAAFTYQASPTGCYGDSLNMTQIGRFAAWTGQIKLQYSKCGSGSLSSNTYLECRFAGALTADSVLPVRSSMALVNGDRYIVKCSKAPDANGATTITLRVAQLNGDGTATVQTDTFTSYPATGTISSTAALSVGNKTPVGTNTDQFIGVISKVAYCQATATADVQSCLDTELPEVTAPTLPVATVSLAANTSSLQVGQQVTYTATVQSLTSQTVSGANLNVALPAGMVVADGSGNTSASWNLGDITGNSSVSRQVVAQLNYGGAGTTLTASANATTTDATCSDAGSNCLANNNVTVASAGTQWVTNSGVDTTITGWTGSYGSKTLVNVTPNITTDAHSGAGDILVTALAGANNSAVGFSDSPRWVTNTSAGTVYTGSIWVKPSFFNQSIVLRLRELNGSTIVTDTKYTLVANTANWQQITVSTPPTASGHQLAFAVYGASMNPGDSFQVDDLSLISGN